MEERKIIVVYVGILNPIDRMPFNNVNEIIQEVTNSILPLNINADFIFIPTYDINTKLVCINPEYITDEDLITNHTNLIKELHNNIIESLNNKNEYN